ncbi:unnamed protein product [Rotaria sp. Silwood1]|nr:unnamed protein product [Rotaria sp. Silwood1]
MKYGTCLFYGRDLKSDPYMWKHDLQQFEAWRKFIKVFSNDVLNEFTFFFTAGNTGVSFVDANMREIIDTGWMSNRGSQIVASYLTKDLGIDWRYGAIDHDVCSNYGNWVYLASVGNNPRENRHFNMTKQAFDYDSNGTFVRKWCPELVRLPNEYIQTPWLAPFHTLKDASVELGVNYPRPIIIVSQWNQQSQNCRTSLQNQHHMQNVA